jgi:23S rRNA (pseudouridine1915-N3)-methyltransferase
MHVSVYAVGRMKAGPERELASRFLDRFGKAGPSVGLDFAGLTEIPESRASSAGERRREEGRKLLGRKDGTTVVVLLDESGRNIGSEEFARSLAGNAESGRKSLILAIGGPDGHDAALREQADLVLSFGRLTWPHQFVRIMLAEQLYRAATILSGHPYHRG